MARTRPLFLCPPLRSRSRGGALSGISCERIIDSRAQTALNYGRLSVIGHVVLEFSKDRQDIKCAKAKLDFLDIREAQMRLGIVQ